MADVTGSDWRKSSYSGSGGQQNGCVEVARSRQDGVTVRDSKDTGGPSLAFTAIGWQAFIAQAKAGRHDLV